MPEPAPITQKEEKRSPEETARNANLHSGVDRGGDEEPVAKHPVRTQAYSAVRRGARRGDNEGMHVKANWHPKDTCDLCGLPLGHSKSEEAIGEEKLRFCCPGCRQVFLLLSSQRGSLPANFKETDLYRTCVESGIIRGTEEVMLSTRVSTRSPTFLPSISPCALRACGVRRAHG